MINKRCEEKFIGLKNRRTKKSADIGSADLVLGSNKRTGFYGFLMATKFAALLSSIIISIASTMPSPFRSSII